MAGICTEKERERGHEYIDRRKRPCKLRKTRGTW